MISHGTYNGDYVGSNIINKIGVAEGNADTLRLAGKNYKYVLMCRVNPKAIRECSTNKQYWVINNSNDI